MEVIALIFSGWLGDRLRRRLLVSLGGMSLALIGMILIVALPLGNNSGRLAGYYMTQASPTPFVALLSLISTNVAGYTKKSTVAAMYLIAYCESSRPFSVLHTSTRIPFYSSHPARPVHPLPSNPTSLTPLPRHRQHNRPSNLPPQRRPPLRPRRNHNNSLLRALSRRHHIHPLLVYPTEQD